MENENKNLTNPQHGEKKKKPQKAKGYFIETTEQKPTFEASAPVFNTDKPQGKNEPHNAQENTTRQNHKKHHLKNGKNGERQSPPAGEYQKESDRQQNNRGMPNGEQRPRPNKNRHRNKPKAKSVNNDEQISSQPSQVKQTSESPATADNARRFQKRHERAQTKPSVSSESNIDPNDYEAIHFPAASDEEKNDTTYSQKPVSMTEVVGIRFKSSGKMYYFAPNGNTLRRGEHAIVETARGLEYGDVAMGNTMVKESETVAPLRPIIRVATPADVKHHEDNKKKEDEAFAICNEKIISHKLDMKLIDAQFTFDNSKLLFYFTSSGRVDFRDLVKDLAGVFRTRIELRQIGIRDEAKIMGGVGMCGRPLCCTLFLSDFGQVSIKMAKEQNLSLNCAKISGICGRLMCCLRYEHETYEYEIKRTPPVDSLVQTADGTGTVTEINPLQGTVKVRLSASPENPPKLYKREDVVMLQKKSDKGNSDKDK